MAATNAYAVRSLEVQGWGMTQIAKKLGISRASVYRALESVMEGGARERSARHSPAA